MDFVEIKLSELSGYQSDTWVSGPRLPGGFCYGGALTNPEKNWFLLVSGSNCGDDRMGNGIWKLEDSTEQAGSGLDFERMPGHLVSDRNQFGTTYILDNDAC